MSQDSWQNLVVGTLDVGSKIYLDPWDASDILESEGTTGASQQDIADDLFIRFVAPALV